MSYNFYILFHVGSVLALSLILGGLWGIYLQPKTDKKMRSLLLGLHGLVITLIFVAGFGLIAKTKLSVWPAWIYIKLGIWLTLAFSPFIIRKTSQYFQNSRLYILSLLFLFVLLLSALFLVKLR